MRHGNDNNSNSTDRVEHIWPGAAGSVATTRKSLQQAAERWGSADLLCGSDDPYAGRSDAGSADERPRVAAWIVRFLGPVFAPERVF